MSSDHASFLQCIGTGFEPIFHHVVSARALPVVVALYKRRGDEDALTMCYSDMSRECYEAVMDYEALRRRRGHCEEMRGREAEAAVAPSAPPGGVSQKTATPAALRWDEWLKGVQRGITNETFTTSWKGANADGREELCVTVFNTTFDLVAVDEQQVAGRTAGLLVAALGAQAETRAQLAGARREAAAAQADLAAERARNASLSAALASLHPEGAGIEAHAAAGAGGAEGLTHLSGTKRKAVHSLVNPSERVRRPRGTRIGKT